jgi:RNA polymerase sigma-70 factor (ECF subfamily)
MAERAATLDAEDVGAQQADAGARAELLSEAEFQDLYRLHARPLWAYLFRLTGNTADADDLLQEAYCRMLATPLATRDDR